MIRAIQRSEIQERTLILNIHTYILLCPELAKSNRYRDFSRLPSSLSLDCLYCFNRHVSRSSLFVIGIFSFAFPNDIQQQQIYIDTDIH